MFAVATLLYDPKYLPGALVLGHSLRKLSPSKYKLVVLIDKSAFEPWHLTLLQGLWDELVDTQVSESALHQKLVYDLKRPELAKTFTKIELWNLPYEKVLYLDADVLPLEGPNPVTDLLKLDFPRGKILAAPDAGFPDIFNSGVFALTPDASDYENLSNLVNSRSNNVSFDGADQGLLNQYFNSDPDWVSRLLQLEAAKVDSASKFDSSNWVKIPFLYNTTPNAQYQYFPALNHFGYPGAPSTFVPGSAGSATKGISTESPKQQTENLELLEVFPYGNIAFDHFSKDDTRAKISVLHFIGAAKPWNNEYSPNFNVWWQQWYEYSGGKSLDVVLRHQKYPISINELQRFSYGVKPAASIQVSKPSDLCDPSNYLHFTSDYKESFQAWDATKEGPPKQSLATGFSLPKDSYSEWDDQFAAGTGEGGVIESDNSKPHGNIDKNDGFGIHAEQIPERVFDDRSDYKPQHVLMMADSKIVDEGPSSESVLNSDATSEATERLSKVVIEDRGQSKEEGGAQKGGSSKTTANIFPWESRENKPERVWE